MLYFFPEDFHHRCDLLKVNSMNFKSHNSIAVNCLTLCGIRLSTHCMSISRRGIDCNGCTISVSVK